MIMIFQIPNVLTLDELAKIRPVLDSAEFTSGKQTAGGLAVQVKDNLQMDRAEPKTQEVMKIVLEALTRNQQFYKAAYPKRALPPLINRYEVGMSYGSHVDNSVMHYKEPLRTDVSVTIFLNDPAEYEGGELVIEAPGGQQRIKSAAGTLVGYPSNSVHHVESITHGVRFAAVTWVQSMIRDPVKRTLLIDLDKTIQQLRNRLDEAPELNELVNCYHNLVRLWVEP